MKGNEFKRLKDSIKNGKLDEAEILIMEMTIDELSIIDKEGHTVLIDSLQNKFNNLALMLIPKMNNKALNAITLKSNNTALIWAAERGFKEVVNLLIPKMTLKTIDTVPSDNKSAMGWAFERGHIEIANVIRYFRLIQLIELKKNIDADLLIQEMSTQELSIIINNNGTVLHRVAEQVLDEDKLCKLLILKMSSKAIGATNEDGNTALHLAASNGHYKVCQLLIHHMIPESIDIVNKNDNTALHEAANIGHEKVCELLIPNMTPEAINFIGSEGMTALQLAAEQGLDNACKLLTLKMSSDAISATNEDGKTALHFAASNGYNNICELLIPQMTKEAICAVSSGSKTALYMAIENGLDKVCELLIPIMSLKIINTADYNGDTTLHMAIENGLAEVCEMLILRMTQEAISAANNYGITALHLAAEKSLDKVCKLLVSNINTVEIIDLFNDHDHESHIHINNMIIKITSDYLYKEFFNQANLPDINSHHIKMLKLYQAIIPNQLKDYLNLNYDNCGDLLIKVDTYITKHYFTLINVCKSKTDNGIINEDNPLFAEASEDYMSCILNYLKPSLTLLAKSKNVDFNPNLFNVDFVTLGNILIQLPWSPIPISIIKKYYNEISRKDVLANGKLFLNKLLSQEVYLNAETKELVEHLLSINNLVSEILPKILTIKDAYLDATNHDLPKDLIANIWEYYHQLLGNDNELNIDFL